MVRHQNIGSTASSQTQTLEAIADGLILRQQLSAIQRQNGWGPANSRRILSREIVIGLLYTKASKERQLWMWR